MSVGWESRWSFEVLLKAKLVDLGLDVDFQLWPGVLVHIFTLDKNRWISTICMWKFCNLCRTGGFQRLSRGRFPHFYPFPAFVTSFLISYVAFRDLQTFRVPIRVPREDFRRRMSDEGIWLKLSESIRYKTWLRLSVHKVPLCGQTAVYHQ